MISAKILLDSINEDGNRLTTFVLVYPRIILAEVNTHRMLSRNSSSCLSGDTLIYTDLPRKGRHLYKYKLKDLYRKWNYGDANGRDMKKRLSKISIRCLNENTNEIINTNLKDVIYSGQKDIYEIELDNGYKIKCSQDHKLFTENGWQTLKTLGMNYGSVISWDKNHPKIATNGYIAELCNTTEDRVKRSCYNNLELHHIDPVWHNKDKAFNKDNIIVLDIAKINPKDINKPVSNGNPLICRYYSIKSIRYIGKEDVYDLEVNGPYHNFIANGIVVHNSRAIPSKTIIKEVNENPFIPVYWGKLQKGMQAKEELDEIQQEECKRQWLEGRDKAIETCNQLLELGLHKQIANRVLEPWMWITQLVSATEFSNMFALRAHKDAQPEFQKLAYLMLDEYNNSNPILRKFGEWHIPFGDQMDDGLSLENQLKVATARAARVSYKNFEGHLDTNKDIELHNNLLLAGHLSPFEHCAKAQKYGVTGNFSGWLQYRKTFKNENKKDIRIKDKYSRPIIARPAI